MNDLAKLAKKLRKFRDERDWKKYHTPKDLAISVSLEASELLEHFQWKTPQEAEKYVKEHKDKVAEELADVFNYVVALADTVGIDILDEAHKKLEKNSAKYPIEKIKGNYRKYTEI